MTVTPYKTYEEKMNFNFYKVNKSNQKAIEIFKEGHYPPHVYYSFAGEMGTLYMSRNLITNDFMYGVNISSNWNHYLYNFFDSIEFNGSQESSFNSLTLGNTVLDSPFKVNQSNRVSPKRNFKNAWPISMQSPSYWYVIQMISHNSFQHKTFYIPPGKTIVFKTIKSIEFFWRRDLHSKYTQYWPIITYNVMSVTANKFSNKSSYITKIFHITTQDTREWNNKLMPIDYSFTFQNDVHPTKLESLKLGDKKEMELGLASQGIQKKLERKEATFWGDFEIKGSTKYNYKTEETVIDYSDQSKKGYLIPYSFSGTMHPKARFSFNDNLKDIYLVTDLNVPIPYLNHDWGQVRISINHKKKLEMYSNKFYIPENEIDLLFKEKELNDSTFERWRK